MKTSTIIFALLLSATLLLFSGCGSGYCSVSGTISFPDGSPLTKGIVVFQSATHIAKGTIDSGGHYVLGSLSKADGLPPGEYKVLISQASTKDPAFVPPPEAPDAARYINLIASDFANAEKTPLKCVVERSGKHDFTVDPPHK